VHVRVNELFINLPSPHPEALACPFTPEVLRTKERALTLALFAISIFGLAIGSIKELGGASS
jgi:hypothetical protein